LLKSPPYQKVISINKKLSTDGNEPLLVVTDDYSSHYVKNSGITTPAYHLINEVICHYLLSAWDIPTPEIAFIQIEQNSLKEDWGTRHKKNYYDRFAFGSKQVDDAFDANIFLSIDGKVDFRKILNPLCFPRIGLFDLWVENDDRPPENLKNLMVQPMDDFYKFIAIDHAFAFRTGSYETLNDTSFSGTQGYCILEAVIFRQLLKYVKDGNWREREKENFYLCIEKSKTIFPYISQLLPLNWGYNKEIETLIHNFLFNEERNNSLFDDYINYWL
jgi:hypothetical protein